MGKLATTPTKLTQCKKPIHHMHGSAWTISENFEPSQISDWGPINLRFGYVTRAEQRVTCRILGTIPPREHELSIFEVPYYEPMGKSATGEDMLTLRCQRQL